MLEEMQSLIQERDIVISSQLFGDLLEQYVESHSWDRVNQLLMDVNVDNCDPLPRTVSYLKKNLVYCFDSATRGPLVQNVEDFEAKFFTPATREARRRTRQRVDQVREECEQRQKAVDLQTVQTVEDVDDGAAAGDEQPAEGTETAQEKAQTSTTM